MTLKDLLEPEISDLVRQRDWKTLKAVLAEWPAPDTAELVRSCRDHDMVILFRLLPKVLAADVFSELQTKDQERLIKGLSLQEIREVLTELDPDDRTELFEELPPEAVRKFIELLPADERSEAVELLGYPEDSVGRLMTPHYIAVTPMETVEQVFRTIRTIGRDSETINMIYVVDEQERLIDDLPIRRLILAMPEAPIEALMDRKFIAVSVSEDRESAARKMKKYNLVALPVVDSEGVLLGIVTVDDALDVLEEEATEDFHKRSAIHPIATSYVDTSWWQLYIKRVVWLLFLLVAGFLSSGVIAHFEDTLQTVVVLAFFIPILIDSGGNTSTQSATLIIRAISLGELTLSKWFQVFRKEVLTGLSLGVTLGGILFAYGLFWKAGPEIGIVLGLTMIVTVLWANLLGGLLPLLLTKLKVDPAIVSAPLLTTVLDSTGLIIYFLMAGWILGIP